MAVCVLWLFLTVPWVGMPYVIVVFPDHTHVLFGITALVFVLRSYRCHTMAVILLLMINCFMILPLLVGVLCLVFVMHYLVAIILRMKRELVALH